MCTGDPRIAGGCVTSRCCESGLRPDPWSPTPHTEPVQPDMTPNKALRELKPVEGGKVWDRRGRTLWHREAGAQGQEIVRTMKHHSYMC